MVTLIFRRNRCDLNQSSNNSTKFGDDWSDSKEMATVLEIQDGGDRFLEFLKICISDVIDMFQIKSQCFH